MGKQLTTILFLCGILLGVTQLSHSQTIPTKDLNLFLGKLTVVSDSGVRYEFTQFEEWNLDTIINDKRWSQNKPYDSTRWVYLDTANHYAMISVPFISYHFFLMHDIYGYGGGPSILTVWKTVKPDSITFVCAHSGYYGGGLSLANILRVGLFPDSSFYVCILDYIGDGGDYTADYYFLRGSAICDFEPFHATHYSEESTVQYRYDVGMLTDYSFDLIETSIYVTEDTLNFERDLYPKKADSASARVIDLWQLAKEKFGVK